MAENIEHLVLERLSALLAGQDQLRADITDIKTRLLTVEQYQTLQHTDMVRLTGQMTELQVRLDRIECRLELTDSPTL